MKVRLSEVELAADALKLLMSPGVAAVLPCGNHAKAGFDNNEQAAPVRNFLLIIFTEDHVPLYPDALQITLALVVTLAT